MFKLKAKGKNEVKYCSNKLHYFNAKSVPEKMSPEHFSVNRKEQTALPCMQHK